MNQRKKARAGMSRRVRKLRLQGQISVLRYGATLMPKQPSAAKCKPGCHRFCLRECGGGPHRTQRGVTLIELLCVVCIIGILFSMLMPTLAKVYRRAKAMSEEWDEGAVASMLAAEVRAYCAAHRVYQFDSKADFAEKCSLGPKCRDWINAARTEFVPFNNLDATNKTVVTFHYGRNHSHTEAFSKGQLTLPPPER